MIHNYDNNCGGWTNCFQPASNAKGNTGVALGATALGVAALSSLCNNGGICNLFGGCNQNAYAAAQAVNSAKDAEIARLKAEKYADGKSQELYNFYTGREDRLRGRIIELDKKVAQMEAAAPLREQVLRGEIASVAQTADCCCKQLTNAVAGLQNTLACITKTVVPNCAVCPGWGPVVTTPVVTDPKSAAINIANLPGVCAGPQQ